MASPAPAVRQTSLCGGLKSIVQYRQLTGQRRGRGTHLMAPEVPVITSLFFFLPAATLRHFKDPGKASATLLDRICPRDGCYCIYLVGEMAAPPPTPRGVP